MRGAPRSLTRPQWVLLAPPVERDLKSLVPFPSAAAVLLWQRGIRSYLDATEFLKPEFSKRSDPRVLADMPKAVTRFKKAVRQKEHVGIFGDYDHDGISGAAIMAQYVSDMGLRAYAVIPDGYSEGHAFRQKHQEQFSAAGVTLLFTIDVGVTNIEAIEASQAQGIDVIVLDHHTLSRGLPPAHAVVDPRREGSPGLSSYLCGAGVAFAFIDAAVREGLIPEKISAPQHYLRRMLDRVAIATIGDLVPILGDNRIFVAEGLEVLRNDPSLGVKALIGAARADQAQLSEEDVAFSLVPRVNAAARMDHANTAFAVLSATDPKNAVSDLRRIEESNRKRQKITEEVFRDAVSLTERGDQIPWAIVVGKKGWPSGVLGLVASRIMERYHRPTVIWRAEHDRVYASARSIPEFDLVEAFQACGGTDVFEEFGGHPQAAGFSLRKDMFDVFEERFAAYAHQRLTPEVLTPTLEINLELTASELTPEFAEFVQKLAPFGKGNPRPRFLLRNTAIQDMRRSPKNGAWREVTLSVGGKIIRATLDKSLADLLRRGDLRDVVCEFTGRGFYARIIAMKNSGEGDRMKTS